MPKSMQHPNLQECLDQFKLPEVRSAARDMIDVCNKGAFKIDGSQMEYRAVHCGKGSSALWL